MSDAFSKVEVITGVARRRHFSTELKLAVVAETMQPGRKTMEVEILKEALDLARTKKPSLLSHSPLPGDTR
jgi:hypothetical protein